MNTARINDITLSYEAVGNGEPVLLISPVLADAFIPLLREEALAARYRLIRYHKRGWGQSTHPQGNVTVADHVGDAFGLLDHLGVRGAHVVGHSSGAAVALQMAADRPAQVRTLGLLEPTLMNVPAADAFLKAAQPVFDAYGAGRREEAFAGFMSAVSGLAWEDCRALLEQRMPGSVAAAIADADTFFGVELPGLVAWRFEESLAKKITQPVLSIVGDRTLPFWIEVAERLRAWLPRVEEQTIAGAGHLLQIQNPLSVAKALADFLARHPS